MDFDPFTHSGNPYAVLNSSNQSIPRASSHLPQLQPVIASTFLHQILRDGYDSPPPPVPELAVRGSWSQQEDDLLVHAVNQIGTARWVDVAKFVPSRTSKQCRERWHNRLSPALKKEPFEPWEDQIILQKQKQLGNRWSAIALSLPGRSPGAVKNRWYAGLKPAVAADGFGQGWLTGDRVDF
jgi:hypothetical protein